jgi:hypothetical protein
MAKDAMQDKAMKKDGMMKDDGMHKGEMKGGAMEKKP